MKKRKEKKSKTFLGFKKFAGYKIDLIIAASHRKRAWSSSTLERFVCEVFKCCHFSNFNSCPLADLSRPLIASAKVLKGRIFTKPLTKTKVCIFDERTHAQMSLIILLNMRMPKPVCCSHQYYHVFIWYTQVNMFVWLSVSICYIRYARML